MQIDRYKRQTNFAPLGPEGQSKLASGRVVLVGCGALGSVVANTLVRAGVGYLRIIDRDFLEWDNLQRQVLYDESDVQSGLPKAVVAAAKLGRINSQVTIEPHVVDLEPATVAALLGGVDMIVDGTDNFETRLLINDAAHDYGLPWVYGGCVGAEGQTMTILPGKTACLRCLVPEIPPPGTTATCDTAGILAPIINVIASLQAAETLKILSGNLQAVNPNLTVIDVWDNRIRQIKLDTLRTLSECPTCKHGDYSYLAGRRGSHAATICGRNAVQLSPREGQAVDLSELAKRLKSVGQLVRNAYLLRLTIGEYQLTVFTDGRTIVQGTDDLSEARTVYARYIGG